MGLGGMARVFGARDEALGHRVAMKVLGHRHAADEQFVERFHREAPAAAGLNHPNIVQVYDRGEADGTYYIAMEYVEGPTLKELLVARGPVTARNRDRLHAPDPLGLRFAHRNGVVHRDIKPHNLIVDARAASR